MAKEIRHHFAVKGTGPFPIDMLRYDHCWPEKEIPDSGNIYATFDLRHNRIRGVIQVNLVGVMPPTRHRWESFGWKLVDERVVTLV